MEKTVLITGGGRGLGLSFVEKFLNEGWAVYVTVRTESDANRLKGMNKARCLPIILDVTSEDIQAKLTSNIDADTKLDLVINNAGAGSNWSSFETTSLDEVKELFNIHCLGVMNVCQAIMPYLSEHGTIVNVSSRFGSISKAASGELDHITCSYSYRVAKAAQNMFTLSLSKEFNGTNRRVFSIHPGRLKTSSAAIDADKLPSEAADELYSKLDFFENGVFYDLFGGTFDW